VVVAQYSLTEEHWILSVDECRSRWRIPRGLYKNLDEALVFEKTSILRLSLRPFLDRVLFSRTLTSFVFRCYPKIQLDDKTGLGFNVRL